MDPCSNDQMIHVQPPKHEKHDTEIDQMAKNIIKENKIKMTLLRNTAVTEKSQAPTQIPTTTEVPSADSTSAHGQFGYVEISNVHYPYIMRSGERYVAILMLQFKDFPQPSTDVALCTNFQRFQLTEVEAKLLNEININHCDNYYGTYRFTKTDKIIRVEDAIEIYKFLEFCHSKLQQQNTIWDKSYGFIRLESRSVFPFVSWNSKRYIPLFYLSGRLEYLEERSVELRGWELAYLKFLCKIHNTSKSIRDKDSVRVVDLEIVKRCFFPGTTFEELWPPTSNAAIAGDVHKMPDAAKQPETTVALERQNVNLNTAPTLPNSDSNARHEPCNVVSTNLSQSTESGGRSYNEIFSQAGQAHAVPNTAFTNPNLNAAPTSGNFHSVNPRAKFKIVRPKTNGKCGPYNVVNKKLDPAAKNGGRSYNEVAVSRANQALTVPQTGVTNSALTSGNSYLVNRHAKFKTMQQPPGVRRELYNSVNANLDGSTHNEAVDRTNKALTIPQSVFGNITNCAQQMNKVQAPPNPPLRINRQQPDQLPNTSRKRGCQLCQIPDYNGKDASTGYYLAKYQVGSVTFEHSINIAPNDNFVLVTLSEVSCVFLKIPYPILTHVLDILNFVVYMPNEAQKKLLNSVGIVPGMGLVSGIDLKTYGKKLKDLCKLYSF